MLKTHYFRLEVIYLRAHFTAKTTVASMYSISLSVLKDGTPWNLGFIPYAILSTEILSNNPFAFQSMIPESHPPHLLHVSNPSVVIADVWFRIRVSVNFDHC